MMKKYRPEILTSIAWRVTALVLALWLVCMGFITDAVARDMYAQLDENAETFVQWHAQPRITFWVKEYAQDLSGKDSIAMINAIAVPHNPAYFRIEPLWPFVRDQFPGKVSSDDWYSSMKDLLYGYIPAMIYYEPDGGKVLQRSGDVLYFNYFTNATWLQGKEDEQVDGYAYIDLESFSEGREFAAKYLSSPLFDTASNIFLAWMRLTGYFEGNEFIPVTIDRVLDYDVPDVPSHSETSGISDLDRAGKMPWTNVLTREVETDREIVTIYATNVGGYDYDPGNPFTLNGVKYSSPVELLMENGAAREKLYGTSQYGPITAAIIKTEYIEQMDINMALALVCHPWLYAALRLWPVYLLSFLAVAALLFLILWGVHKNVAKPLAMVSDFIDGRYAIAPHARWKQVYKLESYVVDTKQALADGKTQIKQLQTALEYAKSAETNRRVMVSNIAHELKTPLAIIHSYAEGLQAGIAQEKQAQYLNVIMEETEKMDALVLDMLDLSRLEAGKVKLTMSSFSLLKLAREVVEKQRLAMESRKLNFSWGYTEECPVTADEARISQVVTNFVTNAVKYTPEGGNIRITVFRYEGAARFSISNDCQIMSDETLSKLWDSFYRADPSRTGAKGTGLGLTISKTIVELHRGTCMVHNLDSGIEFIFTLPID